MRFEHARYITGSPKAGTARPEVCRVTRVTTSSVYYRTADGEGQRVVVSRADFPKSVLRFLGQP